VEGLVAPALAVDVLALLIGFDAVALVADVAGFAGAA